MRQRKLCRTRLSGRRAKLLRSRRGSVMVWARSCSAGPEARSIRRARTKNSSYELMEIPLFPLPNLVLFPNILVPLHIFEDRYKLMINGCIDRQEVFGLVLLRGGAEQESEEAIHRVGMAIRITEVERLPDGRMNIMCEGEKRFRIHRFIQRTPFWKGSVQFFEEEPLHQ